MQPQDIKAFARGGGIAIVADVNRNFATKTATTVFCPGIGMVYYMVEGEQSGAKVSQKLELKSFGPRYVAGVQ